MFKIKSSNPKQLLAYINAFNVIVDELTIDATPEGINFRIMDPSRVSMFDVELPLTTFQGYECSEKTRLTFNVGELLRILKTADETDLVQFAVENTKLVISLIGYADRVFTLPLLESPEAMTPRPKVPYEAKVTFPTKKFLKILESAERMADQIKIIATPNLLTIIGSGDIGSVTITKELPGLATKGEQKATFGLAYMREVTASLSEVCDNVTLNLTTDSPIKLEFELKHAGQIWWHYAPRITSD